MWQNQFSLMKHMRANPEYRVESREENPFGYAEKGGIYINGEQVGAWSQSFNEISDDVSDEMMGDVFEEFSKFSQNFKESFKDFKTSADSAIADIVSRMISSRDEKQEGNNHSETVEEDKKQSKKDNISTIVEDLTTANTQTGKNRLKALLKAQELLHEEIRENL